MSEREEGVGWAKQPGALVGVPGAPPLEDRLLLALRTCATHPAGPLRVVADLCNTDTSAALDVVQRVRERFEAMDMPDDRRHVGTSFLDVIERGFNP